MLIHLTRGEHLQILGERPGGMCKIGICNTKLECGPVPNVMAALPNIGGAL